MSEQYLKPEEAKAYLYSLGFTVSTNFLRVKAREGFLPCIKVGSRYFFSKEQLKTLINAHNSDNTIS